MSDLQSKLNKQALEGLGPDLVLGPQEKAMTTPQDDDALIGEIQKRALACTAPPQWDDDHADEDVVSKSAWEMVVKDRATLLRLLASRRPHVPGMTEDQLWYVTAIKQNLQKHQSKTGYEATGTGDHNNYGQHVPILLDIISRLTATSTEPAAVDRDLAALTMIRGAEVDAPTAFKCVDALISANLIAHVPEILRADTFPPRHRDDAGIGGERQYLPSVGHSTEPLEREGK